MNMSSHSANTWKQVLLTNPFFEAGNKNLQSFASATLATTPEAARLRALTEDHDTRMLAVALVTKMMKLYFGLSNLGGTRYVLEDKIVGLDGLNSLAIPLVFDMEDIKMTVSVGYPTKVSLKAAKELSDLASLNVGTRSTLNNTAYVLLPPFLAKALILEDSRKPEVLFFTVKDAITAFDEEHKDDAAYNKAIDECFYVLAFLWAASKATIPSVKQISDCDDSDLMTWCKSMHHNRITSSALSSDATPSSSNSQVIQQLNKTVQNNTELFERIEAARTSDKETKKAKFDDLPESSKNLILNASSVNGECTPGAPNSLCADFYSKKTASKAKDFLHDALTNTFNCIVDTDHGMATALYSGAFVRERDDLPANFSIFLVPKMRPLASNNQAQSMLLQLKVTHGKGWSEKDYSEAVKQGIKTPSDTYELMFQLKNMNGLSSFFFDKSCILSLSLLQFVQKMKQYTLAFEACQARDPSFATKVAYMIDTRVFRWLQMCRDASDREQVSDGLLDFEDITRNVLLDNFSQSLPSSIKVVEKPTKLGKRKFGETENEVTDNSEPIQEWLLKANENYSSVFAIQNIDKKSSMGGRLLCSRFHTKGYCFPNCKNVTTHIPSKQLPIDIKNKYSSYVRMCRQCE